MPLKLVPPAPKPERTKREKVLDRIAQHVPPHLVACPRCSGMEFIEAIHGVEIARPGTGERTLICLHCYMRGERVAVR